MKKNVLMLLCVYLVIATSMSVFGLSISDDLSDNISADWWNTLFFDPDHAWLEEANGRLEVLSDGTVDSVAFYTGAEWMLDTTQDFSMKVSYYHGLTTYQYTDVMIVVGPGTLSPDDHLQFSASSYENNKEFYVELMDGGTQLVDESFGLTSTDGTLYVSYDAALDELYLSSTGYGSENSQKTISGIIGDNWAGSPLLVGLGGSVDNYVVASGELYLSGFVMDEGTIIQSGMAGLGTEAYPYIIDSLADFDQFAGDLKFWNDYVRMEADIDLSGRTYTTAVIAPDMDNATPDFQGEYYTGVFDGNGHVIRNLSIDTGGIDNDYLGLFGWVYSNYARLLRLGIENVSIVAGDNSEYIGGLCGATHALTNDIYDCYVIGTMSGGNSDTGGLIGWAYETDIQQCYSLCSVSGCSNVGGLIGKHERSNMYRCFASCSVTGSGTSIGGLIGLGDNIDMIRDCYSQGSVDGDAGEVGGFIGKATNHSWWGLIERCYSACSVSGNGEYVGGFIGYLYTSTFGKCFWDTQTANVIYGVGRATNGWPYNDPAGLTGLNTIAMQTRSTYTDAGWDFNAETNNDSTSNIYDLWHMPYGAAGYPMLWYQRDIPGDLTGAYGVDLGDYSALSTGWQTIYGLPELTELTGHWLEGK